MPVENLDLVGGLNTDTAEFAENFNYLPILHLRFRSVLLENYGLRLSWLKL